jgi:preprotein translocase subunit SecG
MLQLLPQFAGKGMATVLLIIHIMVATAMVVIILLQRSEGGALGMGGGTGGFVTGRGAANLLTRTTVILAAVFFTTSILLGILGHRPQPVSAVGTGSSQSEQSKPAGPAENTPAALPQLKIHRQGTEAKPEQPPAQAPAQPQLPQSQ